jgi:exodeoxyribonuclease III
MRIVTWNCQQAFAKKADALLALKPDIATVQECSEADALRLNVRGFSCLWFGPNLHKGLAVFCQNDWEIRALPQIDQRWILPLRVDAPEPFTFIAVWAYRIKDSHTASYIGQVYRALVAHPEWFDGNPVVIAGDFNSNQIWDSSRRVGNHSDVVQMLESHGLVSTYHAFHGKEHGSETCWTLHMNRDLNRPYHVDYIFIPREWAPRLRTVEVGAYEKWSKLSDHCPIIVEVVELPTELP